MQNSLEDFLEENKDVGKVLAHARWLGKLARIYREIVPFSLEQDSTLANYKAGIVVLYATNGTVAAKLRQLEPTLVAGFSKRGIECSGVRVKAQAGASQSGLAPFRAPSRPVSIKPLTSGSQQAIADLRGALPASPLRDALDRFLSRAAKERG